MKRCLFVVTIGACALLTAAIAAAQGTKWHPGHYLMLDGLTPVDKHLEQIDEIQDDKAITGFMVRLWWHDLESKPGVYDFSLIDSYLKKLRKAKTPKYLVVRIMDRRFNTSDPSRVVPRYLRDDPAYHGGIVRSRTGYVARLWEEPVMDRLASLYRAIARRYDSDPLFEGAFTEETTLSLPASHIPSGYSDEQLAAQYKHFIESVKPTMPNSNLFLNANWIGSPAVMSALVQEMRDAGVGAGGSNVLPHDPTLGQQVVDGAFGADFRQEVPIAYGVESGELGNFTPAQIGAYAYDALRANYLFWTRNTWAGSAKHRWETGILPYLHSKPPLRTRCPNVYGSCGSAAPAVTAAPTNEAPKVDAGADRSTQLPDGTVTLQGSATDDAAPRLEWSQLKGPAPVELAQASAASTLATFSTPGSYVLRLEANDGHLSASDDVTVTVKAATSAAAEASAKRGQPATPAPSATPAQRTAPATPAQPATPMPAAPPPVAAAPPAAAAPPVAPTQPESSGPVDAASPDALAQAALAQAAISQAALAQAQGSAPAQPGAATAAATPSVPSGSTGGGGSLGLLELLALAVTVLGRGLVSRRRVL
jgi:hypothetical protein